MKHLPTAILLAVLFWPCFAHSQDKKNTVSVVDFYIPSISEIAKRHDQKGDDNPYYTRSQSPEKIHQQLDLLPSIVADFFGKDDRFTLVDRKSMELVTKERELQKSEAFLDDGVFR